MQSRHEDQPHFYPTDPGSPAFLQRGEARVAIFELDSGQTPIGDHNGAHLAFNVSKSEFERARSDLPRLLEAHRAHPEHTTALEFEDYGLQHSLFFWDPDDNMLELAMWIGHDKT